MRSLAALSLFLALVAAGCLHDEGTETVTVHETVTETAATGTVPGEAPVVLTLFFLQDGKVAPVARPVVTGPRVAEAALDELIEGPTEENRDLGVETAIPEDTELGGVTIDDGIAEVHLSRTLPPEAEAQVVYTVTQFPTVKRVLLAVEDEPVGVPRGRRAFEQQTPSVLVLSPLPGEDVESGFEARGTANTFEATFNYELRRADDRILRESFVTATSGTGTRGTFRFTVRYEVERPEQGRLVVFELSAADGSRINEVSIPLQLR